MKKEALATTAKRLRHHITARLYRLIVALLAGPLPRETADRVAGASNSPHYIQELRKNFLLKIDTERVEKIDRDGLLTRPGVYHLLPESRELARHLIQPDSPASSEADKAA
ncbi:hypothetical protein QVZ43_08585 [Marinobacter sp. chi1]|uniref:Transcriptional regulator n=1 Tax=Marinobacter suaedae TaxID=3057675 RepID=A0ABT8W0M2_9GAMM|nr:hypothetical protein [Marinobacter sp. chi1]MDO3721782.1 hypothetical protein [Marinobacter sp. chi1]